MAEHDNSQNPNEKKPETEAAPAGDLPAVEAPSVSPVKLEEEPVDSGSPIAPPLEPVSPWVRRLLGSTGLAAATIVAAVLGGVVTAHFSAPRVDTAAVTERHNMQLAIARLSREVGTLKSELATASKSARAQTAQLAKLNETLSEKLARESAAVTGSIFAPQTTTAAPQAEAQTAAPAQAAPPLAAAATATAAAPPAPTATPLPPQRPAELAAREEPRTAIVPGWWVIGARRGLVYVRSGRDVFGVAPGARLPGVGLVEDVRREDGGWIVVTRRGIIVAERERRSYDRY
jgi:hypothetical protein